MIDHALIVADLASALVRIRSRSFESNLAVIDRIEQELGGFDIERLDYEDSAGVKKRALVAHRGPAGGLAFSGHTDTVRDDPWSGRVENGILHGLGSVDMKGQVAAAIVAARAAPDGVPATLLITADEETTKAGARMIAERSELARRAAPRAILVAEPTALIPMRGHRSHVHFTATATGVQAHSRTGKGRNANWDLIPFLAEMRALHERIMTDPTLQDPTYEPPFSDFNLVLDNFGTAANVSVPRATAVIKYRYTAHIDPTTVVEAVREAAARSGLALDESRDAKPPEIPADHPLIRLCVAETGRPASVVPYGTDAAELSALAPCVVLGPGDIGFAHTPREQVPVADLAEASALFVRLAARAVSAL